MEAAVPATLGLESNRELDVDESSKTINALLPYDTTQPRCSIVRTVENLSVHVACLMRVRTETAKGLDRWIELAPNLHSGLDWCESECEPAHGVETCACMLETSYIEPQLCC